MWLGVKEHFVILKRQVPSHDPEDSGKGRGPGEASRVCDQARAMWPPLGLPGLIPDLFFGMGLQPPPSRTKPSRKGEINATMKERTRSHPKRLNGILGSSKLHAGN